MRFRLLPALLSVVACLDETQSATVDASAADTSTAADTSVGADSSVTPDSGSCSPGLTFCGTGCVDTTNNDANCGACGHDCADGKCSSSACGVVTVASVDHPVGVAAAGLAVFWLRGDRSTFNGILESCSIVGCKTPTLINTDFSITIAANPHTGAVLLTDGTSLQWLARDGQNPSNAVFGCPIVGCDHHSVVVAQNPDDATQLAMGGKTTPPTLFYRYTLGSGRSCPFGTCSNLNQVNIPFNSDQNAVSIAADANNIYYDDPFKSVVNSCAIGTACSTKSVSLMPNGATLLTVGGPTLIASTGGGTLVACATAGCQGQPTTLATNQPNVTALVADATHVYFALGGSIGQANGEIRSCTLADGCKGGPKSLVTGLAAPNSMALSNGVLFWSNGGTTGGSAVKGSVQKLTL
jgi:hypothetical protein